MVRSVLKISYATFYVYLRCFRHGLLLKFVSQPEIAKKLIKTSILTVRVIQGQ